MNCLTKLFQQKRRRIGYILAFSGPMISKRDSSVNQQNQQIMNINKVKEYGEFVEIAAPVERATAEEYPTVLGGEIWYN